jgi:hypothetical protein
MDRLHSLEARLNDTFVKQAPSLPREAKKALVQYLPWINLILGLVALFTVYALWRWAHPALANSLINYGVGPGTAGRLNFGIWFGLIVLAVEALLYIAAFPGTRDRKKAGWNLMFYALLVNAVYGVVILFSTYGTIGNLISTLIGSAVGLYLLFQIRSSYGKQAAGKKTT